MTINENGPRRAAGAMPNVLIDGNMIPFSERITSFLMFAHNFEAGFEPRFGPKIDAVWAYNSLPYDKDHASIVAGDRDYFLQFQRCYRVRNWANADLSPSYRECRNCPPLGVVVSACIIDGVLCGQIVRSFYASVCEWESLIEADDNAIQAFLTGRKATLYFWEGRL
jgi:hypothetical protein